MPTVAIELPPCLSWMFPAEPIQIGCLLLQRRSFAAQHRADADTIGALHQALTATTDPDELARRAGL